MISNEYKLKLLPSSSLDIKSPKFLFRIDDRIPEHVFQQGFEIEHQSEFNFLEYYFNSHVGTENKKINFFSAYDSIQNALINFRKNILKKHVNIDDLYLYVIRADHSFYNKEITRLSIPSTIHEGIVKTKSKLESEKIIFYLNYLGQYFSDYSEWFSMQKINNDQIFCAIQIKIDFKKNAKIGKNNPKEIVATPYINEIEFRNPNYIELNTCANERPFIYPEENTENEIFFEKNAYIFPEVYSLDITKNKEPYLKSFRCENSIYHLPKNFYEEKWLDKKPISFKSMYSKSNTDKKQELILNFYKVNLDQIYLYAKNKETKTLNYLVKQKKINLLFTYEKNSNKSIFLNVKNNKKRRNIIFDIKKTSKQTKNMVSLVYDKYGRFIFSFNNSNPIPHALTIKKIHDTNKELFELETKPAVLNDLNQLFYLEHAYAGIFYLKSRNIDCNHLELAIKHQNNTFVFLNPKKKYNFAYDLVNINIHKYPLKQQTFIYGWESYCPEMINLNLSWKWNSSFYKPNVFVTVNKNKEILVEQARSSVNKQINHNFIYNINTMKILYIDSYHATNEENKCYCMLNNENGTNKYRWLEWKLDNFSTFGSKKEMWVIKKAKYFDDNLYWIISYHNNDYLWIQQKGDNWGFCFLSQKDSNPQKSSSLFYLEYNQVK